MTDLCTEAAQTTGQVSLFVGIESANWTSQQFTDAGNFARAHGITCIFLKCFEVGNSAGGSTGLWYGGLTGIDVNIGLLKSAGVREVIPYGFLYGGDQLSQEIDAAKQLLSKYGLLCLDMEGQPWASASAATWASQLAQALQAIPGQLWVSCPANPLESGHAPFLRAMLPATNVFMPMAYNDALTAAYVADFKQIGASCVQPTVDLSGEFGANNVPSNIVQIFKNGAQALSIWEYTFAQQLGSVFDEAIALLDHPQQGGSNVILNSVGCVLDILKTNQLTEGEPDLCGPWAVSALRVAGLPGKGPRGTAEDVDSWTDSEVAKQGFTPANFPGSSIPMMFKFIADALDPQSNQRNLHFQELIGTDPVRIRKAVQAGYAVLVTAWEPNIIEKKTGKQAYSGHWSNTDNHILPIVGIDKDGDYICADQLNNEFQGYWPVVYLANKISPSWATIVQLVGPDANNPWLKPIPSGDPSTWAQDFNAQNFGGTPPVDEKLQAFQAEWGSGGVYDPNTGIAQLAYADYLTNNFHGCPVEQEHAMPDGTSAQRVNNGIWIWNHTTHSGEYHPYH